MKHDLFFEIIQNLKSKPDLMRKVKIFAVVGIVGFLIVGALTIWAGISAVQYVASSANQAIQSPVTQGHVESLKAEIGGLPTLNTASCWEKAQGLLAAQPWLERPALANLMDLKVACLEEKPTVGDKSHR